MIYICIPTYNESPTIGVLLWRIRRVFQDYSREYEIIVYDDASTDATGETLQPYADVIPLTILRGETRKGYGFALEKLCRTSLPAALAVKSMDPVVLPERKDPN